MNNSIKAYFSLIYSFLLMLGSHGFAQQAAVTVNNEGIFSGETFTIGWEFEVDAPVSVSAFGRVLTGSLSTDSEIRLYRLDTGAEVGSATIPQSTTGESAGAFYLNYFVDLPAAISLDPGIRYLIAAEALNGDGFLQDTPATLSSPIRFIQGRAADFGQPLPNTANITTFPIERNVSGISYLGPTFRFTNAGNGTDPLSITSLDARSVFQRDETSGSASLPISGVLGSDPVTRVEARAVPTEGGVAVDWTTIDSNPDAGSFSGNLTVSGGRYRIEARAFDANGIRYAGSASLIGVGDVYVVAGQSNAANFGESLQSASDDRVSTVNLETNLWLPASDPMPNAGGGGGSPWPRLGDLLVAQENVPIAIIAVAQGGTTVGQWLPGGQLYTQQLLRALNFVRTNSGVRAVLWHQGESDAASGTSDSVYTQRLQSIIAQSRIDSGINLPWGVALASADPLGTAATEASIIAGQQAVIDADPLVFQGASTNDFGGLGLVFDGVHFSNDGLNEHAARWSQQINDFFGNGGGTGTSSAVSLVGEGIISGANFTVGWEFDVANETTVTRLGRVIPLGTSLGADSPAAIYNLDTGVQIASATIPQATTGEPISAFHQGHYATLATPITLTTGVNYVILVEALDGAGFFQDTPGTTASGINYIQGRATNPDESLPATATEASLPIARNETGLSYLGATFDIEGSGPPPQPPATEGHAITANSEGTFSNATFTVGWQFRVNQATEVTRLGRVTASGESLGADSPTAIYRLDNGSQVASVTIPAATAGESIGSVYQAHYANLATPVSLQAGFDYVILTEALDGVGFYQDVPSTVSAGINYIAGRATDFGLPLPALASDTTLPITRNDVGVSYLGAIFDTSSDTTPPTAGSGNAVTATGEGVLSGDSFSIGWEFTVSAATDVDKLGRVTRAGQSLIADSPAAIYRLDTGAQVASATISSTAPGETIGSVYDVHYTALATPVTLQPGTNYVVLVEATDGAGFDQDVPAVVQSGINYIAGRAADPGLGLPALGTDSTLPIVRDVAGISYLGAMFSTVEDTTPPVDTTPPSATLTGPSTTSGSYSVSITFSESVTGLSLSDVDVANGTASTLTGSGSNYTINVSPQNEGIVTVNLPAGSAADVAGNTNTAASPLSTTFLISDTTPPTVELQGPAATQGDYTVTIIFSEPVSGLELSDIDMTNGTASALNGSGSAYTFTVTPQGDGTVSATIGVDSVTDAAGNPNSTSNTLATIFTSPPTGSDDLPWIETFDGLANGTTNDNGDTAWSSSRSENYGVNNDQFRIFTTGGTAEWQSEEIQIGGATVRLSLDLQAAGQLESNQDFIDVIALIDGTETVLATRQGLFNQGNTDRIAISGLSGQTLQIIIRALTTGSTEVYTWDNIRVVDQNAPVLEMEAEDGVLRGFTVRNSSSASGGAYIRVPNNGSDPILNGPNTNYRADYTFTVSQSGTYQIRGTILAPTSLDNSFFVQVNGAPSVGYLWDTPVAQSYTDDLVNDRDNVDPVEVQLSAGPQVVTVYLREDGTRLDKIALVLITPDGGGPGTTDALGTVAFPTTVQSPSTVTLEIPYETTQRRAIQIRLHDADSGFETVGQADTTVEAGVGTLSVSVPVLAGAREGSGYLWALRLLPVDWASIDQALAEDYADASVERNTGGGATSDLLLLVDAPATVQPIQTVPLSIDYEATQRRTLAVWLHDLNDNFRTIGFAQATVDPGFGTQTFDIGIVGDARVGAGHLWAVRLLPEGENEADAALDDFYQEATVIERTTSLVNFAVLPGTIATQSSLFGGSFEARLAADGNTDGDWRNGSVTHTELGTNAWWEIDLGSVKAIDNVLVWNRTDCCAERLSPFYVLVSNSPFGSHDLDSARNQAGVSSYQVTETPVPTRQVNVNRSGRYVRIQLAGANYLSLAEVEVYGENQGLVNGVTYEYFEGVWDQLPDFNTISPIETGTATNFDLGVANQNDFFAVRFRGCLNVPADGTYTFYTASDDGSRLFIDGNAVVNNDGLHALREVSGSLTLTAGMHPMEAQFFERSGEETLIVSWEGNGISKQPIADQFLSVNETGISPGFHHVGRQVAADDNADGDLLDVTAEYALGRDPSVASMNDLGLHIEAFGEQLDVWYDRPARLEEIAYTLEYSDDLATWTDILSPTVTSESYGTERVRYEDLGQLDLVNSDRGFVRLRIKHHAWNHETTTPTCGWYSTTLHEGYQTHGLSLNREPVFGSTLADIEDNKLVANSAGLLESIAPGRSYYVEITSGALEGHRLELNETDSEDQRLAVDWASPLNTLADTFTHEDALEATFVVREHWTLEDAYPSATLQASTDPVFADQIQFFNVQSQSFDSVFALGDANESFWVANDDNTLASQAARIIPPGMGYFIKRPSDSSVHTIRLTGHVRESAFIQPLSSGHNLVASPSPLASHAQARGLTIENGFLGSRDPDAADQIQVWKGDASSGEQGYNTYFLLDVGQQAARYWTSAGNADLDNADEEQIFAHDRAVFIQLTSEAHPAYRVPAMLQP